MAKGIIYIMTTVVEGLIKIGKTQTTNYESRMQSLEKNGYRNITGLHRKYAIEVEEYDEKEMLLDKIFDRSRVPGTELFAMDVELAVQLLSSFEGKQIYPKPSVQSKKEVFEEATDDEDDIPEELDPEEIFYLKRHVRKYNNQIIQAQMKIVDGRYVVLKGSDICPLESPGINMRVHDRRAAAKVKNNKLTKEESFRTPGGASTFVTGVPSNGRRSWKTKNGIKLREFLNQLDDIDIDEE